MDVEEDVATIHRKPEAEVSLLNGEQEVEAMVGVESSEEEDIENAQPPVKVQRIWPEISTSRRVRCEKEVRAIREMFHDEVDMHDTTMVSEYSEEIFEYMCDLEVCFCFLSSY
jgi:diphthamide biosynthesis methyltransferase